MIFMSTCSPPARGSSSHSIGGVHSITNYRGSVLLLAAVQLQDASPAPARQPRCKPLLACLGAPQDQRKLLEYVRMYCIFRQVSQRERSKSTDDNIARMISPLLL